MMTTFGPVDLLGSIGRGRVYQDLLADSEVIDVAEGLPVRVLGLETQIAVKEEIGAEKDRAVLPILRRVLKESQRSDQ
jgi:predicted nucleotidyltransferase